jgi:hypothetical protein
VLQISAVHRPKDSEIDAHGKGVGNCPGGATESVSVCNPAWGQPSDVSNE